MPRLPGRPGTGVDVAARWFPGRVQAPRPHCSEGSVGPSRQFETRTGPWLLCGGERGTQALGVVPGPGRMVQLPRGGRKKGHVEVEVGVLAGCVVSGRPFCPGPGPTCAPALCWVLAARGQGWGHSLVSCFSVSALKSEDVAAGHCHQPTPVVELGVTQTSRDTRGASCLHHGILS